MTLQEAQDEQRRACMAEEDAKCMEILRAILLGAPDRPFLVQELNTSCDCVRRKQRKGIDGKAQRS